LIRYSACLYRIPDGICNAIEVDKVNPADFKVEGTSMLSKYTSDMNKVIRRYKRDRPHDDNTMYLFFVQLPDLGNSRKGFMKNIFSLENMNPLK